MANPPSRSLVGQIQEYFAPAIRALQTETYVSGERFERLSRAAVEI
jgi:hypothetical protein